MDALHTPLRVTHLCVRSAPHAHHMTPVGDGGSFSVIGGTRSYITFPGTSSVYCAMDYVSTIYISMAILLIICTMITSLGSP